MTQVETKLLGLAEDAYPDQEQKKRIRKMLENYNKGPSTEEMSNAFVAWKLMGDMLGQPFDSTKIPITKLYQMRRDPMIAFGLQFVKVPLIRAPWYIRCEDDRIAAFVEQALEAIYEKLITQYTLSLDFGYQGIMKRFCLARPDWTYFNKETQQMEPVWDEGNVDAIVWKPFVALRPESIAPLWNEQGEFDGIQYTAKGSVEGNSNTFPFPRQSNDDTIKIPLEHSLWVTNEKDSMFGSLWGYPRVGYAYRYWWSYWYNWALADRHFEHDADPPMVVYHPDQKINENGEGVDASSLALAIGQDARSGSTIALPNTLIPSGDGTPSSMREWEIKALDSNSRNFDAFNPRFEYLDVMKLRSIMVPEHSLIEGSGGTSSRNVAAQHGDIFQESQAVLMEEIDEHINRFMIPQLVYANFPEFDGEVKKVTRGFSQSDMDIARQIVQVVGQSKPDSLGVDVHELLETMGIPMLTPQEKIEEEEKAREQQVEIERQLAEAKAKGASTSAVPGGNEGGQRLPADVPGMTKLSLEDAFDRLVFSDFPDSKHYEDPEIHKLAMEFRRYWEKELSYAYEDFSRYLSDIGSLSLAEEPDDESRAQRILAGWDGFKNFQKMHSRAVQFVRDIFKRAGDRELETVGLSADAWTMSDATAADWVARQGMGLVKGIEDTTRDQLRNFLSRELSSHPDSESLGKAVYAHFTDFPRWRANSIARTETMNAYNHGMLLAGGQAGIDQVQALDARKGATDQECEDRDGEIFGIEDALGVSDEEHVNGTLAWRFLPKGVNLSVETGDVPDGALALLDDEDGVIYLSEDLTRKQRSRFLIDAVDHIVA